MLKLKVIILIFSIIFGSKSVAADRILPVLKPSVDQEIKKETAKKKLIYPKKKPTKKVEIVASEEVLTISESLDEVKKDAIIYPQKKPVIVQKKVSKTIAKSKILSKNDFKIAKAAFDAVDKKKWKTAIKISKKAKDKVVFKTIFWLYLIQQNNIMLSS